MIKEDVMHTLNAAKNAMGMISKVQYLTEIKIAMPVGKSGTCVTDKVDILYEIDKADKKAYIKTSRVGGNKVDIAEFYYGDSASYVKSGKNWVKTIIAANQYEEIFDKLELPGEILMDSEGFQIESGEDIITLKSSVHVEKYAKLILEKVSLYDSSLTQKLDKGIITIEIDKKSKVIERLTLEAEGVFGEKDKEQEYSEKIALTMKELPADYKIKLPEMAVLNIMAAGIENLSLQEANALANCNCTGCTACLACLACLACISCLFPPLFGPAAAAAIFASIAASVSISFGVARAAQAG